MFDTSRYGVVDNNGQPMIGPPEAPPPQNSFNLQEAFGQGEQNTWSGKDYMQLFQGIGGLAMAGGKTFQDIYLASKIEPRNVNANINLDRQDAFANLMSTQNQNFDANIRQAGAVPQVYAPSNTQTQDNTNKIIMAIAAALGVALILKK